MISSDNVEVVNRNIQFHFGSYVLDVVVYCYSSRAYTWIMIWYQVSGMFFTLYFENSITCCVFVLIEYAIVFVLFVVGFSFYI